MNFFVFSVFFVALEAWIFGNINGYTVRLILWLEVFAEKLRVEVHIVRNFHAENRF